LLLFSAREYRQHLLLTHARPRSRLGVTLERRRHRLVPQRCRQRVRADPGLDSQRRCSTTSSGTSSASQRSSRIERGAAAPMAQGRNLARKAPKEAMGHDGVVRHRCGDVARPSHVIRDRNHLVGRIGDTRSGKGQLSTNGPAIKRSGSFDKRWNLRGFGQIEVARARES
jgi:hypothetical protein